MPKRCPACHEPVCHIRSIDRDGYMFAESYVCTKCGGAERIRHPQPMKTGEKPDA